MSDFLTLALLVVFTVTVTGYLIAAVSHVAVHGVRRQPSRSVAVCPVS